MIILPRQARDKHRESTQKKECCVSHRVYAAVELRSALGGRGGGACDTGGAGCQGARTVTAAAAAGTPSLRSNEWYI